MIHINAKLKRDLARHCADLADLWRVMLREGLAIDDLNANLSEPEATFVEELKPLFFSVARWHLASVMGANEVFAALVTGQFPEFPNGGRGGEEEEAS